MMTYAAVWTDNTIAEVAEASHSLPDGYTWQDIGDVPENQWPKYIGAQYVGGQVTFPPPVRTFDPNFDLGRDMHEILTAEGPL